MLKVLNFSISLLVLLDCVCVEQFHPTKIIYTNFVYYSKKRFKQDFFFFGITCDSLGHLHRYFAMVFKIDPIIKDVEKEVLEIARHCFNVGTLSMLKTNKGASR